MGIGKFLKHLVRGTPPESIPTQLSETEAIGIARRAASDHWLCDALKVAVPQRNASGAVVWIVETGGVGSSLRLVILDETGEVLDRIERSGR